MRGQRCRNGCQTATSPMNTSGVPKHCGTWMNSAVIGWISGVQHHRCRIAPLAPARDDRLPLDATCSRVVEWEGIGARHSISVPPLRRFFTTPHSVPLGIVYHRNRSNCSIIYALQAFGLIARPESWISMPAKASSSGTFGSKGNRTDCMAPSSRLAQSSTPYSME